MAEFSINEFVDVLRTYMYGLFPLENDDINLKKHKNRPFHIRDIAFMFLPITREGENTIVFDIGSDYAEEYYPYYHILEDAEVIRKRGRATTSSRGSQAKIEELSKRDYGRINFNGKTYSREYRKNVRGERSRIGKATRYVTGSDGKLVKINADAAYYYNKHYHYIEKILDYSTPFIADYFGMRLARKQETSLQSEYNMQKAQDYNNLAVGNLDLDIIDIFNSFNEGD